MKKIGWALPLAVAYVLTCALAFAGEAAKAAGILPEPVETHWLIALMVVVIPAVRTGLSNDTVKLPTAAAPWRAAIVAILAGAATLFDQLMNGFELNTAALAFLTLSLPSIVQEVLKVVFGGSKNAGGGSSSSSVSESGPKMSMRPPPGYSTKMQPAAVGVAIGFCALVLAGCGAGKFVCPVLETAAELCPLIAVRLPDGTTEMVPAEAIAGMARQARAARLAGAAKASDAGVDQ
jgi:hypothetical protein